MGEFTCYERLDQTSVSQAQITVSLLDSHTPSQTDEAALGVISILVFRFSLQLSFSNKENNPDLSLHK